MNTSGVWSWTVFGVLALGLAAVFIAAVVQDTDRENVRVKVIRSWVEPGLMSSDVKTLIELPGGRRIVRWSPPPGADGEYVTISIMKADLKPGDVP